MKIQAEKPQEKKSSSKFNSVSQKQNDNKPVSQFVDNQAKSAEQQKLQKMAKNSPQIKNTTQLQEKADNYTTQQQQPIQLQKNNTGLPDHLKTGIENLSGYSMDDVKVHRNSDKPAQLQAHAYAQGSNIHLAPGQEKHLPHEAWHVVQQKQGRVKPTIQLKGKVNLNDDQGLEKEADVMGVKALLAPHKVGIKLINKRNLNSSVAQGMMKRNFINLSPKQITSGQPAIGGLLTTGRTRTVAAGRRQQFNLPWFIHQRTSIMGVWTAIRLYFQQYYMRQWQMRAVQHRAITNVPSTPPIMGSSQMLPKTEAQEVPSIQVTTETKVSDKPEGLSKQQGKDQILHKLMSNMEILIQDYATHITAIKKSEVALGVLERFAALKVDVEQATLDRTGEHWDAEKMSKKLEQAVPKFSSHEVTEETVFGNSHGYSAMNNKISMRKGRISSPGQVMHEFSHAMDNQLGHGSLHDDEHKETAITELTAFTVQAIIDSSTPISQTSKGMTKPGMPLIAMVKDMYAPKLGIYAQKPDSWWNDNIVPKVLDRVAERIPKYKRAANQGHWIRSLYTQPMDHLDKTPFPNPK